MPDNSLSTTTWQDIARRPVLVTATTLGLPVTVEEMKAHLRLDTNDEDDLIRQYIEAAAEMVEDDAEIALLTSTYALYLDMFPAWTIELRKLPVQSVSSVVYLDVNGTSQTMSSADYRLDAKSKPARLTPAYDDVWPSTYDVTNAVTITFVAGDTNRDAIPDKAKQAIRLLVAHWYRNRETVVSTGAVPQVLDLAYDSLISRLSWSGSL